MSTARIGTSFTTIAAILEPHTNRVIGLGTLSVRAYLSRMTSWNSRKPISIRPRSRPTAPRQLRRGAVVEKEGFLPLFSG